MIYELDNDMREFLIRHKAELKRNDLNAVYTDILDEFGNVYMPEFTKFFLSKGINPLMYFNKTIPQACFYEIQDIGEKLAIKQGITDIGFSAFLKCNSIKEVSFPSSLEHIDFLPLFGIYPDTKIHYNSHK